MPDAAGFATPGNGFVSSLERASGRHSPSQGQRCPGAGSRRSRPSWRWRAYYRHTHLKCGSMATFFPSMAALGFARPIVVGLPRGGGAWLVEGLLLVLDAARLGTGYLSLAPNLRCEAAFSRGSWPLASWSLATHRARAPGSMLENSGKAIN